MLKHIVPGFRRRWSNRSLCADWGSLATLYYDALIRATKKGPGFGSEAEVGLKALPDPVLIRLGRSDGAMVEEIFLRHEYAPARDLVEGPVKLVVDLGSNIGLSLRQWHAWWPQAKLIGVEPDARNAALCRKNLSRARVADVQVVEACIAARPRAVYLQTQYAECAYKMSDEATAQGHRVDAITLPELLARCQCSGPIDLLKCDIEGAEAELFSGCAPWIRSVRHLLVEVHGSYTLADLLKDLAEAGSDLKLVPGLPMRGNVHFLKQSA